jgi:starch synthase
MQKLKKLFKNARTRDVFEQNIRKIQKKTLSLHQFSKPQTPKEKIKSMNKTKILFINTEVMPYLPEARMSSIGRQLPQGIQDAGHEIRTFMPRFGLINERRNQLHEVIRLSGMNLIINDTDHPLIIKVASIQQARMQVYFIDNDEYFTHRNKYGNAHGEYSDNAERCVFFARGVIETIRKLRWKPDVVYCQGWFSAISPIYIKKTFAEDPCFRGVKIVFDMFNNGFEGHMASNFYRTVKREGVLKADLIEVKDKPVDYVALCKLAVKFSDGLIITDNTPAAEEVKAYAESRGIHILDATDEELDIKKYDDFFELFNTNSIEED